MVQGKAGRSARSRLPITPRILRMMKAEWERDGRSWATGMLWAASVVAFFSFCRSGEITVPSGKSFNPKEHLTFNDLAVDSRKTPTVVALHLKKTKTDPFMKGVQVTIGQTGGELCPVEALMAYLRVRGSQPGPLFMWENRQPLTRDQFVKEVRKVLKKASLPAEQFAGHSFRIGAATTAATVGVEDSLIQTLGRWKSTAYLVYVKLDPSKLAAVSRVLAASSV